VGAKISTGHQNLFAEVKSQDGGKIFEFRGTLSMVKLFSNRLK